MKSLSLFDGSGGFLLAGEMCGIEPVYASEIEPYLLEKTGCCSICGEQIRMPHEIYKYCPNCGAIMDGDSK